eukprot:Sspe_Gene.102362::Locus_77454_Transcript_1_2_Confidence_0.667_Length_1754::g.102362::m.102362
MDGNDLRDVELEPLEEEGVGEAEAEGESSSCPLEDEAPSPPTQHPQLRRELSMFQGVSYIVGTMIGSGIFASPGLLLDNVGSPGMSLVVWGLSGVVAMAGALSYAELGTTLPESGGEVVYLRKALGGEVAFVFSWVSALVIRPASAAIIATTFSEYVLGKGSGWMVTYRKLLASGCIMVATGINCVSVRASATLQKYLTIVKVLSLVAILLGGALHIQNVTLTFEGTSTSPSNYATAFYNGLWAYDGWNTLNYAVGEMKDPHRLARAIQLGVVLVIFLYLGVNVAYLAVVDQHTLASSTTAARIFGEQLLGSTVGLPVASAVVAVSTFCAVNGVVFTASRLVHASAVMGLLPPCLGMISASRGKARTPMNALMCQLTMSVVLIALIPDIQMLISYYSSAAWIFYFITVLTVLVLRCSHPALRRPYKVYVATPLLFCAFAANLIVMAVVASPIESLVALAFSVTGFVVYYLLPVVRRRVYSHPPENNSPPTFIGSLIPTGRTDETVEMQDFGELDDAEELE